MESQRWSMVLLVFVICVVFSRFGRHKRQSGRPVTPRDYVFAMAAAWALGWLWIGLPSLADWGSHMPWSEILPATLFLIGLAFFPLIFALAATWIPPLFAQGHADRKSVSSVD
jgi:hypothetical protein